MGAVACSRTLSPLIWGPPSINSLCIGDAPVAVGGDILAGDRKIGEVLNADGKNCLAVVAVDKIDAQLVVNDAKLSLIPLAYLDLA